MQHAPRILSIPLAAFTAILLAGCMGESPTSLSDTEIAGHANPGHCKDPDHSGCDGDGGGGGGGGGDDGGGGGKATFNLVFSGHITGGKDGLSLKADDPFQHIKEDGAVLQLVDAVESRETCDGPVTEVAGWGLYAEGEWISSLDIAKRGGSLNRFQIVGDQADGGHINIVLRGGVRTELADTPEAGDVTVQFRDVCAKTSNTSDDDGVAGNGEETHDRILDFDVVADRI